MALTAPQPLADHHRLDGFDSGVPSLDEWLRRRARTNQTGGASRSYVLADGEAVAGYYALASGHVATVAATGRFRRNMPDPIPVAVLARLAVDHRYQGQGLGRALFRDAAARILGAAQVLGIRGIITHAVSNDAKGFYLALGFDVSPMEPMTLMVTLADVQAALSGPGSA